MANLRNQLQSIPLQDLRNAARLWNWSIKGTSKADIVQQLMQHLANAEEMAAAFRTLSATQQQVAIWLAHMGGVEDVSEALRTAIGITEGRDLAKATLTRAIAELRQRLIVLDLPYQGLFVPRAYQEWLPALEASQMVYAGELTPGGRIEIVPPLSVDQLSQHSEQLLTMIEREHPVAEQPAVPIPGQRSVGPSLQPHAGIVSSQLLAHWGYIGPEEQNLARTLLSIMLAGGLCVVQGNSQRLALDANAAAVWRDLSPEARRTYLRGWWTPPTLAYVPGSVVISPSPQKPVWDELDLALLSQPRYELRSRVSWVGRENVDIQIRYLRFWLLNLITAFRKDVWYDAGRFFDLIFKLRRDLFLSTPYQVGWDWYLNGVRLDVQQMSRAAWEETFGLLVVAWLTGPATWLGFVQTAVRDGRVVAFMLPGATFEPAAVSLHADALRFLADGRLILRNTWQTGDLRKIICKIAAETARDRETTTYMLSTEAFRNTLLAGQDAEQVIAEFADAGFALPAMHADRLRDWQARLGLYQLYDNLGVIEFNEDGTLAEVQATIGLGRGDLYPVTPRCLVVLRSDTVADLVEELRRKGYTPQVKL